MELTLKTIKNDPLDTYFHGRCFSIYDVVPYSNFQLGWDVGLLDHILSIENLNRCPDVDVM